MSIPQEQDDFLRDQFISETNESECVYMLVDADSNYAVLTDHDDLGKKEEKPIYFAFSNRKLAADAIASGGFEDCSIVALEHEHFLQFLHELHDDDTGIMLNPHAPDMVGEEYESGDVYNELGEAWDMFED